MGLAQTELSNVLSTLSRIYVYLSSSPTGAQRPAYSSSTWSAIEKNIHRLLVLRGLICEGDKTPEDPWVLFLREFGARNQTSPTGQGDENAPPSILLTSPQCRGLSPADAQRRVRFQSPLPRRGV